MDSDYRRPTRDVARRIVGVASLGIAGVSVLGIAVVGPVRATLSTLTGGSQIRFQQTPATSVKVLSTIPKQPGIFTEGLQISKNVMFESSGLYGQSAIDKIDSKTGKILLSVPLDNQYFAEGLTVDGQGAVWQITWKEGTAFKRDPKSLQVVAEYSFSGEGWGLCYSTSMKLFVQSDGSGNLTLRDPKTFEPAGTVAVHFGDGTVPTLLNELECDGKHIYANVWTKNNILQIDLPSGLVTKNIDASAIVPAVKGSPDDVLNGIAKLSPGKFVLTGKRWSKYFIVSF